MVATAILLGYYDVYVNNAYVSDSYRSGYGTTESFHQLMRQYINPNGTSAGIEKATTGVRKYLADRNIQNVSVNNVIGSHTALFTSVYSQIRSGLPVVTAMFSSYNSDCTMDHSNVTYGYTQMVETGSNVVLETYYHVHNGWRNSSNNLMTYNYAWFADGMYIS